MGSGSPWKPFEYEVLFLTLETATDYSFSLLAAAAAAKSLQSCPTLCYPIDGNPPGSPVPGILQARILEWVAISFSSCNCLLLSAYSETGNRFN